VNIAAEPYWNRGISTIIVRYFPSQRLSSRPPRDQIILYYRGSGSFIGGSSRVAGNTINRARRISSVILRRSSGRPRALIVYQITLRHASRNLVSHAHARN